MGIKENRRQELPGKTTLGIIKRKEDVDVCLNLSGYIEVHSLFGCASEHVKKFMDLACFFGSQGAGH